MSHQKLSSVLAVIALAAMSSNANASGVLVAAGDEWLLTNSAYSPTYLAGTTALVKNIATTFGGSNYLLLSGDAPTGGFAGLSSFAAQLQSLGKTVSYSDGLPGDLSPYSAVFHIGQYLGSTAGLDAYVAGGGNLYISLGGGYHGTAEGEADFWNPFLAGYGLVAGSTWFTTPTFVNATVTSGPTGVTNLLWGYGQSIEAIPSTAGVSYVRGSLVGGPQNVGLIGTSSKLVDSAVPEPATWLMLVAGFGLAGAALRRRGSTRIGFAVQAS